MDFRSRLCLQVLPSRLDWEGNVHSQTFEELVSNGISCDMAIGNGEADASPPRDARLLRVHGPPRKVVR